RSRLAPEGHGGRREHDRQGTGTARGSQREVLHRQLGELPRPRATFGDGGQRLGSLEEGEEPRLYADSRRRVRMRQVGRGVRWLGIARGVAVESLEDDKLARRQVREV